MSNNDQNPKVGIIMGSQSDWETMKHAHDILHELGIPHEVKIVSAHRTPDRLVEYAKNRKRARPSYHHCWRRWCRPTSLEWQHP